MRMPGRKNVLASPVKAASSAATTRPPTPITVCRSGSCRIARRMPIAIATTTAAAIAQPRGANVSTMTRAMPGALVSMTPRRPPIISAMSNVGCCTAGTSPSLSATALSTAGRCGQVAGEVRPFGGHPADRPATRGHPFGERDRVVHGRATRVVVEVDVDVFGVRRIDVAHGLGPAVELVLGVERPRWVRTLVEAQVTPVGRPPQRRDRALAVGPAERRAVPLQQVPDV